MTLATAAGAATSLATLRYTPDITVNLGGTVVTPRSIATDSFSGAPTLVQSNLPADLATYFYNPSKGLLWLVFSTTVTLPGGITATPQDVIAFDGATYSKIFDGAAQGIPAGVAIDALSSINGLSDFLFSFDTTATVGSVTVAPSDIVYFDGAGNWNLYFTAANANVPSGVNLDALDVLPNGNLLMAFDTAGMVGGVNFGAGDVLEYTDGLPGTWELSFSPAATYPGWGAAVLRGLWAQPAVAGSAGMLQFSAPTYSVNESGANATITVTRTGGSTGAVSVSYTTSDGSATAPAMQPLA